MQFCLIDADAAYREILRYHLAVEWPDASIIEFPDAAEAEAAGPVLAAADAILLEFIFDPQTSGGLLLAIANALSHDLYYKIIDPQAETKKRLIVARVLLLVIGGAGAFVASLGNIVSKQSQAGFRSLTGVEGSPLDGACQPRSHPANPAFAKKGRKTMTATSDSAPSPLLRAAGFGYAAAAYLGFFASFGYFILRTMGYVDRWGIGAGVTLSPLAALSLNVALIAVFAVVIVSFRGSVCDSLVALTPVVIGSICLLGFWGYLGRPIDLITLVVMPILLGIGIDDGLHAVHGTRGTSPHSLADSVSIAGRAMTLTTLTTCVGFGSLMLSHVPGLRSGGALITAGVVVCLVATLVVLPAWDRAASIIRRSTG